MYHKALETITKYQMIQQGETVVTGVSGGADSVALLHFLCDLRETWSLEVVVCHINHCLRGSESDRDEAFVRELCAKYDVKLFCFTEDIASFATSSGQSIEMAARERRYARFNCVADRLHAKIATAHTLSDSIETALLHFTRGTALRGICGIPPVRGNIVRPLIEVTRSEIEGYCQSQNLCYVTDSTNLSDMYTRNHIRHHVIPQLNRINPQTERAFLRLSGILRETQEYLDIQAKNLLQRAALESGYRADVLSTAHPAVAKTAIARLLGEHGITVSADRVERILYASKQQCVESGEISIFKMCKGIYFYAESGILSLGPNRHTHSEKNMTEQIYYPIKDGLIVHLLGLSIRFLCYDRGHYEKNKNCGKSLLKNHLDYDKICGNAVVRTRKTGDHIALAGRDWTKSLKKLFAEYKIPLEQREQLLVCADERGVFWVQGFGVDQRVVLDSQTHRVLTIKISTTSEAKA